MIGKFSIKDLEKLSGIKAHTLRIWEQRYGILKPKRTDTNIRSYNNDELKLLLNITLLYNNGYKISKIAAYKKEEITDEVNKIVSTQINPCEQIDGLIIAMVEMDEQRFEKIISTNILQNGFNQTIENVIYPFLKKIGVMWQTGCVNPAQEHFISNLIRQKLIVAIDGQIVKENAESKKFVLFLPELELHELSLLYFNYLLKSKGHNVTYLGQSVPMLDLQKVIEIIRPDYLVSVITQPQESTEEYFNRLAKCFPKGRILISGCQVVEKSIKTPKNISIFKNSDDLLSLLSNH